MSEISQSIDAHAEVRTAFLISSTASHGRVKRFDDNDEDPDHTLSKRDECSSPLNQAEKSRETRDSFSGSGTRCSIDLFIGPIRAFSLLGRIDPRNCGDLVREVRDPSRRWIFQPVGNRKTRRRLKWSRRRSIRRIHGHRSSTGANTRRNSVVFSSNKRQDEFAAFARERFCSCSVDPSFHWKHRPEMRFRVFVACDCSVSPVSAHPRRL